MYDDMDRVGQLLAMDGHTVLTGGFGGVGMEAPARGAKQAGGKCIGYTMLGKPGNSFLTQVIECRHIGTELLVPELQFGVRLGRLLLADGFILAAGGGPGTLLELLAVLNLNMKFWEKVRPLAILKPEGLMTAGWDGEMIKVISAWCQLPDSARDAIHIVSTPTEAVTWALGDQ